MYYSKGMRQLPRHHRAMLLISRFPYQRCLRGVLSRHTWVWDVHVWDMQTAKTWHMTCLFPLEHVSFEQVEMFVGGYWWLKLHLVDSNLRECSIIKKRFRSTLYYMSELLCIETKYDQYYHFFSWVEFDLCVPGIWKNSCNMCSSEMIPLLFW